MSVGGAERERVRQRQRETDRERERERIIIRLFTESRAPSVGLRLMNCEIMT